MFGLVVGSSVAVGSSVGVVVDVGGSVGFGETEELATCRATEDGEICGTDVLLGKTALTAEVAPLTSMEGVIE